MTVFAFLAGFSKIPVCSNCDNDDTVKMSAFLAGSPEIPVCSTCDMIIQW